ncbi:hypothetical protein MAR_023068 [Mya arenaria]|uniref:Uncharacterized protein n=1 Tax=Mya arenaria TaxID=6604 RepID=A0ABY7DQU1_MYAAR|nr:hypothetical protein MAR_023068 [Mya arenaria]
MKREAIGRIAASKPIDSGSNLMVDTWTMVVSCQLANKRSLLTRDVVVFEIDESGYSGKTCR